MMKKVLLILLFPCFLGACKKILFEEKTNDPVSIFNQTWEFTNEKYSFFNFKNINWDSIKTVYSSKISEDITEDSLFSVLSDMLYILKDGHVNLTSPFDVSRNWEWYLNYPSNYNPEILERSYFNSKQQFIGPFTVFDFEDIGYVHYGSFSREVTSEDMELVLGKFRDHKGLIIDLRNNGGGSISNVYNIGNYFVKKNTPVGYQRLKNGPGKNDFSEYFSLSFTPVENFDTYDQPVVLLTNRKCYSATNMFRTMMGALPQVTVIGDHTGGGGGVPTQTQLTNGWMLRVSSTQMFTLTGENNEHGLAPDIALNMNRYEELINIDSILEKALSFLRE